MNILKNILICISAMLITVGCSKDENNALSEYVPHENERLTVYTSHKKDVWQPIIKEFEERYGIWVNVIEGGTSELLEKISSGSVKADVMFGGGIESLEAFKDCFIPYKTKENVFIRSAFVSKDNSWTPFSALPIVISYNPKLVTFEEVKGWNDLLNPKFKGKIAFADPEISGSSFTALMTFLEVSSYSDEDTIEAFAKNLDGRVKKKSGEVLSSVLDGENYIGISIEEMAYKITADGKDLKIVYPDDGTGCVPDGTAIVKGCCHEENAKLFIDFTVSKEIQRLLTEKFYRRSVRLDIPVKEPLPSLNEIKLIDYDTEKISKKREKVLSSWEFFLGKE